MAAMVKIGDTAADIAEGRNAGMWTIGITRTGNEIGLTEEEWARIGDGDRDRLLRGAERRLLDAGAHYAAPSVAECDVVFDQIDARLAIGERPSGVRTGSQAKAPAPHSGQHSGPRSRN